MEFSVEVDETTNVATVEMNSTNLDTGIVQVETIAEIDLNFDFDTGPELVEIDVASIEAEVSTTIDTAVADAVADIEIPNLEIPETNVADSGNVNVEVEVTSEPSVEVEVNTTEGGLSENASTEPEISETEVGTDTPPLNKLKVYKSPVAMWNSQWEKVKVNHHQKLVEILLLREIPVGQKPNPKPIVAEQVSLAKKMETLPGEMTREEMKKMLDEAKENRNQKIKQRQNQMRENPRKLSWR